MACQRLFALLLAGLLMAVTVNLASAEETAREFYEVRTYQLGENGNPAALDAYLEKALLPALQRQGIGPVGVLFDPQAEPANQQVTVVIPYNSPAQLPEVQAALASDEAYQKAGKDYLELPVDQAPFSRIRSELLIAFESMPRLEAPTESIAPKDERVYELRTYESATEQKGIVKVHMFNNGEIPIFLDCGIQPVFFGQAIVGPNCPNLTYLTVYPTDEARQAGWKAFVAHPDWATLKVKPEYANTVSKIEKAVLKAKPYSQW